MYDYRREREQLFTEEGQRLFLAIRDANGKEDRMKQPVAAWTKHRNTMETDKMPMVMHVVEMDDGTQKDVLATDPMDAIEKVRKLAEKV
jgi:hypothetical protein